LQIYEEIKDMTPQERIDYFNKSAEELSKEFGFKIYNSVEEVQRDREARRAPRLRREAAENGTRTDG